MKKVILLIAAGLLAVSSLTAVFADPPPIPPGQKGYEGQPGNQGNPGGNGN